jgi:hypothetical protein
LVSLSMYSARILARSNVCVVSMLGRLVGALSVVDVWADSMLDMRPAAEECSSVGTILGSELDCVSHNAATAVSFTIKSTIAVDSLMNESFQLTADCDRDTLACGLIESLADCVPPGHTADIFVFLSNLRREDLAVDPLEHLADRIRRVLQVRFRDVGELMFVRDREFLTDDMSVTNVLQFS